jgi:F0F1-type ATP synthase membrane subunit b/b'
MIFDEKFIIALAFFVCVGLIIKFSRKNFSKFLLNTKNSICETIDNIENNLIELKSKISQLNNEKEELKQKSKNDIHLSEKEKIFLIENAQKKSEQLIKNTIDNQNLTNERIIKESKKSLEKISWDAAKENLIQNLVIDINKNQEIHDNIINNILNETLNDK